MGVSATWLRRRSLASGVRATRPRASSWSIRPTRWLLSSASESASACCESGPEVVERAEQRVLAEREAVLRERLLELPAPELADLGGEVRRLRHERGGARSGRGHSGYRSEHKPLQCETVTLRNG